MGASTIISIFMFLKELVFGKKNSNSNKSLSSKTKNWIIFVILISSLSINYFLGNKIVRITVAYIALDKETKKLKEELKNTKQCHATNEAIEKLFSNCKTIY